MPVFRCTQRLVDAFEKNIDKSIASYINQTIFEYKYLLAADIEEHETFEIQSTQKWVNKTPRIKREPVFPDDYVRRFFGI